MLQRLAKSAGQLLAIFFLIQAGMILPDYKFLYAAALQ